MEQREEQNTKSQPRKHPVVNLINRSTTYFLEFLGIVSIFFDLRGIGYDSDIIFKDRYRYVWAFNSDLELLWKAECNTGHYPYAYDVDGDGKDELAIGYSLFDDDGKKLWGLDSTLHYHADGVAILNFKPESELRLLCTASDEGIFFTNMKGEIIKHHYLGHVQNPAVANFRDDLPRLEIVTINYWRNQGIIHYFDAECDVYHCFEPNQYGSMCLPVNWIGKSEEFFVHNPNMDEGGMFDGWGRKVVVFPDDGHPDMCNAVLDITGDCRDEVVVWDPHAIWVYTQDNSPLRGKLYKPLRNPLYNYSNYQATVSMPGWKE
jgi:rhamnogalacturonan endolyase